MENEIIIRKVTDKDFDGLVKLYSEVWNNVTYNKDEKANFILRESKGISYCAEKEGEIVGSRISFFLNFFFGKRQLTCVQVGDSCTRKDCRGQGLFGKMNKAFLADYFSPETGGELIWNISVEASKRVNEKLGWNYIQSLQTIIKFARPLHIISKVGLNIRALGGDVAWDLTTQTSTIDEKLLIAREKAMTTTDLLHMNYDSSTFNWRMKSKNGIKCFKYDDLGVIIYKIGEKKGLTFVQIGEVFLYEYDHKHMKALLKSFQKALKPDVIKTAISLGHPLYGEYAKCGFRKIHFLHHGVRVETQEMKDICYKPENWAISMLDVDTF